MPAYNVNVNNLAVRVLGGTEPTLFVDIAGMVDDIHAMPHTLLD